MESIDNNAFERKGKSFSRNKKHQLRIDMTPMVDLGFLLITFFVFTTTMSTPMAADLIMPSEKPVRHPSTIPKSLALTFLLDGNDKIFYYHGEFDEARRKNEIFETSYSTYQGLGTVIREKQRDIEASGKFTDGRKGLMLLIKPAPNASYKNVIDALDEVMINDVRKYVFLEPDKDENTFLRNKLIREQVE